MFRIIKTNLIKPVILAFLIQFIFPTCNVECSAPYPTQYYDDIELLFSHTPLTKNGNYIIIVSATEDLKLKIKVYDALKRKYSQIITYNKYYMVLFSFLDDKNSRFVLCMTDAAGKGEVVAIPYRKNLLIKTKTLILSKKSALAAAVSTTGRYMCLCYPEKNIIYDLHSNKIVHLINTNNKNIYPSAVCFLSDNKYLVGYSGADNEKNLKAEIHTYSISERMITNKHICDHNKIDDMNFMQNNLYAKSLIHLNKHYYDSKCVIVKYNILNNKCIPVNKYLPKDNIKSIKYESKSIICGASTGKLIILDTHLNEKKNVSISKHTISCLYSVIENNKKNYYALDRYNTLLNINEQLNK